MVANNAINLNATGVITNDGSGSLSGSAVTDNTIVMGSTSNLLQDTTITVSDNGEMVNSSQPAFFANANAGVNNVTGDGTVYTVIFNSEKFDQNSDYNNSTGEFTAPVTGRYQFNVMVTVNSLLSGHINGQVRLVTTALNDIVFRWNPYAAATGDKSTGVISAIVPMTATDTASVQLFISGSTKTVQLFGASLELPVTFSGFLVC